MQALTFFFFLPVGIGSFHVDSHARVEIRMDQMGGIDIFHFIFPPLLSCLSVVCIGTRGDIMCDSAIFMLTNGTAVLELEQCSENQQFVCFRFRQAWIFLGDSPPRPPSHCLASPPTDPLRLPFTCSLT